jgi:hypothetical protein
MLHFRASRNANLCTPTYRFLSTLNWILKSPARGGLRANNLIFRYDTKLSDDGVGGEEGGTSFSQGKIAGTYNRTFAAFSLCTLWAVEA